MPHVRRLRPDMAWEDVLRIINAPLPRDRQWTQSRLLRAVNAYVRDSFLPEAVVGRAGRREADDRLPDTGVPLAWERLLSAVFVQSPDYGTRASTLLLRNANGDMVLHEKSFAADGSETQSSRISTAV